MDQLLEGRGDALSSDLDMFGARLSQIVQADFEQQALATPLDLGALKEQPVD